MTGTPFILLGIGLLLIFLEFFFPGGILGTIAGVLLIASIVFFALDSQSAMWTFLYTLGIAALVALLVKLTLSRIRKGKFKGVYQNDDQSGYFASSFDKELIGKRGEALSDLRPSGHILVEGKRYQAVLKSGYLEKGSPVEVIGGEGAHLIVKEIK